MVGLVDSGICRPIWRVADIVQVPREVSIWKTDQGE